MTFSIDKSQKVNYYIDKVERTKGQTIKSNSKKENKKKTNIKKKEQTDLQTIKDKVKNKDSYKVH